MSADIEAVWAAVAQHSRHRAKLLDALRDFLTALDNPHACILTGRKTDKPADMRSAEELESHVIGQYRERKLSKLDAADCLRLLFDAQRILCRGGCAMHPTRLADVLPPEPSPFSPEAMASRRRVESWQAALDSWIIAATREMPGGEWQAAIGLSAVLHGALLDPAKLKDLLARVSLGEKPARASGWAHFDFQLPFQGLGNYHGQRWFPDPLTSMLIERLPAEDADRQSPRIRGAVSRLLVAQGVPRAQCPAGVADLVQSAATWWSERAAQIDIHGMRRTFTTHGIDGRSWWRLHGRGSAPGRERPTLRVEAPSAVPEDAGMIDDVALLHPWLEAATALLAGEAIEAVRPEIMRLLQDHADDALAGVYLGWLADMLAGHSSTRDALSLSTLRRRFLAAAPGLLLHLGNDNPAGLDTEVLEDHYAELVADHAADASSRDLRLGLREFHAFLVRRQGRAPLPQLAKTLGEEADLRPVDANLISFDDYLAARDWLDARLAQGRAPDDVTVCQLVMMFAFRLGMRRMEILGLRLEDLHFDRDMICVVRPHAGRRLKTKNAQRLIPLRPFLDWRERQMIRAWLARRRAEEGRDAPPAGSVRSPYVFARVDAGVVQVSVEGIGDRICEAIRAVTEDRHLFLHHLRHAFGTWTYLRLRAPDYPELADMFAHLPATAQAIRQGRRLRTLLLHRAVSPSRAYAFAVAGLLGHSGPAVSMAHYIHGGDLVLGAIVQRELAAVPREVLVAASGLGRSQGYAHLRQSSRQLERAIRPRTEAPAPGAGGDMPREQKPPGRPRQPLPHQRASWLPWKTVRAVLHLCAAEQPPGDIARVLNLAPTQVDAILDNARRLAPRIDLAAGEGATCPKARTAQDQAFEIELEAKFAAMARRAPLRYVQGLDLFLAHFNRQKQDVVFKGHKDLADLRRYLFFLKALGIAAERCQWVLRRPAHTEAALPGWAVRLSSAWATTGIRRIAPPTLTKASSYAQWLGIQIVDEDGRGLGKAMAVGVFLARIALSFESSETGQSAIEASGVSSVVAGDEGVA